MTSLADEGKSLSACETSNGGDSDFDLEAGDLFEDVVRRVYPGVGYDGGLSLVGSSSDAGEEPVSDDPVRDSISQISRELKELRARVVEMEDRAKAEAERAATRIDDLEYVVANQERQIGLLKAKAYRLDEENHQLRGWLEALDSEFDDRMDRAGKVLGFVLTFVHWYDGAAMDDFKMGARIDILRDRNPELYGRYVALKKRGTKGDLDEVRAIEMELKGILGGVDVLGDLGDDPFRRYCWWALDDSKAERMDAHKLTRAAVEKVTRRPKPSQTTEERIDSLLRILGATEMRKSPSLAFKAAKEKLGLTDDQMKKLTPYLKASEWFEFWTSESGNSRPHGMGGARKKMIGLTRAGIAEAERRIYGRSQ